LRGARSGGRCFVLGNGPSLERDAELLPRLAGEYVFAVNYMVAEPLAERVQPDAICLSNGKFWRDGLLAPRLADGLARCPQALAVFDDGFRAVNERAGQVPGAEYLHVDLDRQVARGYFHGMLGRGWTAHGETVIIDLCLPVAYWMGFAEVYLLGCDCDYGPTGAAYFYDPARQDVPLDAADYLAGYWQNKVLSSYPLVRSYFEFGGRRIVNCTAGGRLEAFERRPLAEVLA
jgi:hypothetical protein